MANEITVSTTFTASKGNISVTKQASKKVDLAGTHYTANIESVPTTAGGTLLGIGSNVGTAGYSYFRNTSATNYVEVGVQVSATFYPLLKLKPGEFAVLRLAIDTVYARANTAAVDLEYVVLED